MIKEKSNLEDYKILVILKLIQEVEEQEIN
jgi:hypothetical protein